jgi:hypothetical protein
MFVVTWLSVVRRMSRGVTEPVGLYNTTTTDCYANALMQAIAAVTEDIDLKNSTGPLRESLDMLRRGGATQCLPRTLVQKDGPQDPLETFERWMTPPAVRDIADMFRVLVIQTRPDGSTMNDDYPPWVIRLQCAGSSLASCFAATEGERRVTAAGEVICIHLARLGDDGEKKEDPIEIPDTFELADATYETKAVVIHEGTDWANGHYYAIVRSRGKWFHINDSQVTQGRDMDAWKQAYLVFARRARPDLRVEPSSRPGHTKRSGRDAQFDPQFVLRVGFSVCTEISLGCFSLIAFYLCVASLVLFFVALERGHVTVPALTNITAAVLDHKINFTGGDLIDNGAALQIALFFLFGAVTAYTHATVAFVAAVDAFWESDRANWRTTMVDAVLSMNTVIGTANTVVLFNLPLVMTNLITIAAKRRLLDDGKSYPIIVSLWAVMLVALLFHYVSTKAYDCRVTAAASAKIRSRVSRCLDILRKHITRNPHPLPFHGGPAESANLKQAYLDVKSIESELHIYCSRSDVENFRGKIDLLRKALEDYGKAISALQHTPGGVFDARGTVMNAALTQAQMAQRAVEASQVNGSPALAGAMEALDAASASVTSLLRAANAVKMAPALHAAQSAMAASVRKLRSLVGRKDGAKLCTAAAAALRRANAVQDTIREAAGAFVYTDAELLAASSWVSHAVRYADDLDREVPQAVKTNEAGTSTTSAAITV